MKIIGMMTVRDEGDILEESLSFAAEAYTAVLCVDCGSTDNSLSILDRIAARHDNVHFLGAVGPKVAKKVRRHIWEPFRKKLGRHDWWAFADADEFVDTSSLYDTVEFATRMMHDHIDGEHINFYYTNLDYDKWKRGEESLASRAAPISQRRKYYRLHTHQIRLFRNLPWLRWNSDSSYPDYLSSKCNRRIQFRHYQYRDAPQIERRISIRSSEYKNADPVNLHWLKTQLEDAISDANEPLLHFDDGTGYVRDPSLPDPCRQGFLKSAAKFTRNVIRGTATSQVESNWFASHRKTVLFR